MISKKGFLFTISIILFATTLVFYTQVYSDSIVRREFFILDNYKSQIVPFIIDDIATDVANIVELNINSNFFEEEVYVNIIGVLPKNNLTSVFNDYNDFLNNVYFTKTLGEKSVNFSNVFENGFILNFPNNKFIFDYNNSKIILEENFNSLDLNLFLSTGDLNHYEFVYNDSGETVPINIRYFDDVNAIIISQNINLSEDSFVNFVYNDDSYLLITIGSSDSNKYFSLDTNKQNKLNYSLGFNNDFHGDFFKSKTNIPFKFETEKINVDSFIIIR